MRSRCWPSWWRWGCHPSGLEGLLLRIQRPGIPARREGLEKLRLPLCFSVTCTSPCGEPRAFEGLSPGSCRPAPPQTGRVNWWSPPAPHKPLSSPSPLFQAGSKNVNFQPLVQALSDIPNPSESGPGRRGAWGGEKTSSYRRRSGWWRSLYSQSEVCESPQI